MDPANDHINSILNDPENLELRLSVAESLVQQSDFEGAAKLIRECPVAPGQVEDLERFASCGGTEAIPFIQAYIQAAPTNKYAHELLAYLYREGGDEQTANYYLQVAETLEAPADGLSNERVAAATDQAFAAPAINQAPDLTPVPHQVAVARPSSIRKVQHQPKKKNGTVMMAILIAVGVHLVIGVIAAVLIILPPTKDEPEIVALVAPPSVSKRKIQKKNVIKQVKKTKSASAAAAPIAKMMRANATARISMPKVTRTSTGPLGIGDGDLGSGGFGGGGGGGGAGLGSGAAFFGGEASGERFLFILDHSQSMKPQQIDLRNKEISKALRSLKGTTAQYQVILFAGTAIFSERGWKFESLSNFGSSMISPDGTVYDKNSVPKAGWLEATASNISGSTRFLERSDLALGTNWGYAFKVGFGMDPSPDVIFFMSDGVDTSSSSAIRTLGKRFGNPIINTVAMQTTEGAKDFAAVARDAKGTFTIVDKRGKPVDGFKYLKNPGEYKGRFK